MVVTAGLIAMAQGRTPPPRFIQTPYAPPAVGNLVILDINDSGMTTGYFTPSTPSARRQMVRALPDGTVLLVPQPGYVETSGRIINEAGQIAGVGVRSDGTRTIIRYAPGSGVQDLGHLGGTNGSVADMNDSGAVIGGWDTAAGVEQAFLFDDAHGLQNLGAFATGAASYAVDINNSGVICGDAFDDHGHRHGFVSTGGPLADVGSFGGNGSQAYYLNHGGVIVGSANSANGLMHAYSLLTDGTLINLEGQNPAVVSSIGLWINNVGDVVGLWKGADGKAYWFFCGELGPLVNTGDEVPGGYASIRKMNDRGEVLVVAPDYDRAAYAAYYVSEAAGFFKLNDLLLQPLPYVLESATINELGQIAAYGHNELTGKDTAVFLQPVMAGDLNCDGAVTFADIDPFVLALSEPAAYAQAFPACGAALADTNCDGVRNFKDIDGFVACLGGRCRCAE